MGWTIQYNSMPAFVVDWESIDRNSGRQIDWARVPDSRIVGTSATVTANGAAAAAATSITVDALTADMPVGTVLNFTGSGEFARLTAPAFVGDTTLTVEALDAGIEDNDTATFQTTNSGKKVIPAGTVMSQLASGKVVPRVDRPGSEAAVGILISTATEGSVSDSLSGYGIIIGGVIYENLLPETITAYKTELETNGTSWAFETYADDTEA